MIIEETFLSGCFIITPDVYEDERGVFFESFHKEKLEKGIGQIIDFVQDNQSQSVRGVLRGLHFQDGDFAQAKLVRVVKGEVLDICVDLRENSKTFGKYVSIVLNAKEQKQLFIPKGFAHGFLTLSDSAIFSYKCDAYYNKDSERGIIYNDPILNIDWNFPESDLILSQKDKILPSFEQFRNESQN